MALGCIAGGPLLGCMRRLEGRGFASELHCVCMCHALFIKCFVGTCADASVSHMCRMMAAQDMMYGVPVGLCADERVKMCVTLRSR